MDKDLLMRGVSALIAAVSLVAFMAGGEGVASFGMGMAVLAYLVAMDMEST